MSRSEGHAHKDDVMTGKTYKRLDVESDPKLAAALLGEKNGWLWGPLFFSTDRAVGLWDLTH
jgi:hypothetical protein